MDEKIGTITLLPDATIGMQEMEADALQAALEDKTPYVRHRKAGRPKGSKKI